MYKCPNCGRELEPWWEEPDNCYVCMVCGSEMEKVEDTGLDL